MQHLTAEPPGGRPAFAHVAGLDGVRAVAVLLVVGFHTGFVTNPGKNGWLRGGWLGVDVFFVLSGFLITSILLRERGASGRTDYGRFYLRRACRLLPALALFLVGQMAWAWHQGTPWHIEAKAVGAVALYASNFWQAAHRFMPDALIPTWSLAVEEQFYVVWPLLLAAILWVSARSVRRRSDTLWSAVPVAIPVLIVASLAVRIVLYRTHGYPAAYMLSPARADGLFIGCGLAFLRMRLPAERRLPPAAGWVALAALIGLGFAWSPTSKLMYYGGFTAIALIAAVLVDAMLTHRSGALHALLSARPLVAIGRVSYGLYLWHLLLLEIVAIELPSWPRVLQAALGVALAGLATALSWVLVEKPALAFKRRFETVDSSDQAPGQSDNDRPVTRSYAST